ncbi:hypothetical protein T484DRAFT_1746720 [Baffinella frigidus]|nr:hypothetical protein T484DRAFT_1746720 [Cryptophyta sp. CCMP2293]
MAAASPGSAGASSDALFDFLEESFGGQPPSVSLPAAAVCSLLRESPATYISLVSLASPPCHRDLTMSALPLIPADALPLAFQPLRSPIAPTRKCLVRQVLLQGVDEEMARLAGATSASGPAGSALATREEAVARREEHLQEVEERRATLQERVVAFSRQGGDVVSRFGQLQAEVR